MALFPPSARGKFCWVARCSPISLAGLEFLEKEPRAHAMIEIAVACVLHTKGWVRDPICRPLGVRKSKIKFDGVGLIEWAHLGHVPPPLLTVAILSHDIAADVILDIK